MHDKNFWKLYAWVIRGSQRKLAMMHLERPMIVTELRKKINADIKPLQIPLSLREVSRHLTSFAKKGLAECLNPKEPLGHIYQLTKKGALIREQILEDIKP